MKRWTDNELEEAVSMLSGGMTYGEIAKKLDRTVKAISSTLTKKGHSILALKRRTKFCRVCKGEFEVGSTSRKETCSEQCFSIFSVRIRTGPKGSPHKMCSHCSKHIQGRKNRTFCDNKCSASHRRNEIFRKIESGELFPTSSMKKYLIHKHGNCCMKCGWKEMNETSGIIPVQLDHIDGNSDNNSLTNIRLLCPNCHSLTPTYGSLNKNGSNSKKNRMKLEYYHRTKQIEK